MGEQKNWEGVGKVYARKYTILGMQLYMKQLYMEI